MNCVKRGLTLVEILVALSILLIAIIFAANLGVGAAQLNRRAKRQADARIIAFKFAEMFRSLNYSDTTIQDDGDVNDLDDTDHPDHKRVVQIEDYKYTVMWNVADNMLYDSAVVGIKTIKIFVLWAHKYKYTLTVIKGNVP